MLVTYKARVLHVQETEGRDGARQVVVVVMPTSGRYPRPLTTYWDVDPGVAPGQDVVVTAEVWCGQRGMGHRAQSLEVLS